MKKYQFFTIIILTLLILGFDFYWFVYRPEQIRKECSWTHIHIAPSPAHPGKTEEEIEVCKQNNPGAFGELNCEAEARTIPGTQEENYWREATLNEFNACLRKKGL